MKRNLIFIHLESLNQAIFSHRHWFPCLNSIVPHSLRLNNFISSATSSFMAVSDLLHGDDNVLEHNVTFEVGLSTRRKNPSLYDQLSNAGYRTAGVGFPKNWASFDSIWSEKDRFNWFETPTEMLQKSESLIANHSQPFALYVWNLSSHLCYQDSYKASGDNTFNRWQRGYESMDNTVGDIIRLLMKHKQMEKTTIVIFGDHGDDFWNHGIYGGFAHGIEPYTSLVHTPAFIYDSRYKGRDINNLVSMIDLRKTALELLGLKDESHSHTKNYSALNTSREYAYSRNLFAAQEDKTSGNPLRKGYAITSELFHLVYVNDEYKMYAWQADGANQFNLLEYINSNNGNFTINYNKLGDGRTAGPHPHIQNFLYPGCESLISFEFQKMSALLQKYISNKTANI